MITPQAILKSLSKLALLIALCLGSNFAAAEVGDSGFWSLQLENDMWGSRDDRFYTNGLQFSYVSPRPPPSYLDSITDRIPFYHKSDQGFFGFNLGQQIFTPEDIEESLLQINDRPYAGWLYVESIIGHRYQDLGDREKLNGFILTLGVVGPASFAEESQRWVHNVVGSPDPKGWEHQLSNELGIGLTYLHRWRRIFDIDEARQREITIHSGVTLGNVYSYGSLGFMTRWGTHLKDDIGPPTISPGFPGLPIFNANRQMNWYLFAGLEVRAMGRNIFLDGNTNVDSHSVEKETWVADLQLGVAFHFEKFRLSFSQMSRSREFAGQGENTRYGAINFTLFVE